MGGKHACVLEQYVACMLNQNCSQVEGALKNGVKEYMRRVVKMEILAKFTDWRRRFHEIFTSVDEAADGVVAAAHFVGSRIAEGLP